MFGITVVSSVILLPQEFISFPLLFPKTAAKVFIMLPDKCRLNTQTDKTVQPGFTLRLPFIT